MELNLLTLRSQQPLTNHSGWSKSSESPNLLDGHYALQTLEAHGEHAWVTKGGVTRYGWVMRASSEFVTYIGNEQRSHKLSVLDSVDYIDRHSEPIFSLLTLHGVIRFKRDIRFPKFAMEENERWTVCIPQDRATFLAIEKGDRFLFGGGDCHPRDVEVIYLGPPDNAYRRAMGYTGAGI